MYAHQAGCQVQAICPACSALPVSIVIRSAPASDKLDTRAVLVQVCNVTCSGVANFKQHCLSWRHQRRVGSAASATLAAATASSTTGAADEQFQGNVLPTTGPGAAAAGTGHLALTETMFYVLLCGGLHFAMAWAAQPSDLVIVSHHAEDHLPTASSKMASYPSCHCILYFPACLNNSGEGSLPAALVNSMMLHKH